MYNRYIPNGASYTRVVEEDAPPTQTVPPDAPPPEPDAEAPESAKPASGLGKLLRGLKLDGLDTGDVLLLLILLFLFLEGDDMELVITLGLLLLLGLAGMLFASVAAMRQEDVKRMIAYSSSAQISYIFLALGLGSRLPAARYSSTVCSTVPSGSANSVSPKRVRSVDTA